MIKRLIYLIILLIPSLFAMEPYYAEASKGRESIESRQQKGKRKAEETISERAEKIINLGNLTPEAIEDILNKISIDQNKSFMENFSDMSETRDLLLQSINWKYKTADIKKLETKIDRKLSEVLAANYDKNTLDGYLLIAVKYKKFFLTEFLINAGANVNTKSIIKENYGRTPLLLASKAGNKKIAELLIKAGANIEAKDTKGNTALILASKSGNLKMAELLINAGADVNAKDNHGETALIWAENVELAKLLIDSKANINEKDNIGNTALMRASGLYDEIELVDLLIKSGADIFAKNNDGETALDIAREWNNQDIISLLESKVKEQSKKSEFL